MKINNKKAATKTVIVLSLAFLYIFLTFSFINFVSGSGSGAIEKVTTTKDILSSNGISGMRIVNLSINGEESKNLSKEITNYKIETTYTKNTDGVKQDIYLTNKLDVSKDFDISTIIEIDYPEIRWNGTRYDLTKYAKSNSLNLIHYHDKETGKLIVPNIFFDDKFNKRINYQDVAEQGGYAVAYSDKGKYYVELKISKQVNALTKEKIDPTYTNQTDGFSITSAGGGTTASGIYFNNSNFWVVSYLSAGATGVVYSFDKTGANSTYWFITNTSTVFNRNPLGLWGNNSDFWITNNLLDNIYQYDSAGNPLSNFDIRVSFGMDRAYGLTGKLSNSLGTNLWIVDDTDNFVYQIRRDNSGTWYNQTGFDPTPSGAGNAQYITTTDGNTFFIIDVTDNFVYNMDSFGNNLSNGFSLSQFGINSPGGITTNVTSGSPRDFWVTDSVDLFVYHITAEYDLTIDYPSYNLYSTNTQLNVNYTRVNSDLTNCWYSNDSYSVNTSLATCGTNITGITWSEGRHNVIIYANTSTAISPQINVSSLVSFTIDTINPDINITSPINNSNQSNNLLEILYTRSDVNPLTNCWYSNDSYSVNTSLGFNCMNITSVTWSEGQHNVIIWANDSVGNKNYSIISFTIDTIKPAISITYPNNNTNSTNTNLNINYTFSDLNLDSIWYSNDSMSITKSLGSGGTYFNITNITWSEGFHNVIIYANDTLGNINSSRISFTIDTINPNATLLTPINNTLTSNNSINFTANLSDNVAINNATLLIINSSNDIVNKTTISYGGSITSGLFGVVVNLAEGKYNWSIGIFDTVNHYYNSGNNTLTIYSINATLLNPINNTITSNSSINFTANLSNGTLFNGGGLVNATLFIYKIGSNITNQSFEGVTFPPTGWFTGGDAIWHRNITEPDIGLASAGSSDIIDSQKTWINTTYLFNRDGNVSFFWNVSSEKNYDNLCFCIDNPCGGTGCTCSGTSGTADAIITSSSDGVWTFGIVSKNVNAGLHTFTWCYAKDGSVTAGADMGKIDNVTFTQTNPLYNQTTTNFISNPIETVVGTIVKLAVGIYNWFYTTFDLSGNSFTSTTYNLTISSDLIYPDINLTFPINTTYNSIQTKINFTTFDINLDTCWYSIDSGLNNITTSCYLNITGLTSSQGSNTWLVGVNDSNNNINSSSVTFFVDSISPNINITSPINNTNSSNNLLDIFYTRSDTNLQSCWYSNDTYLSNTTLASCGNITSVIWSDAKHNVIIYANDTLGNINSSRISFTIDTINPDINITSPLNNSNSSDNTLDVFYTISDSNLASCWYSNDTYLVNTSLTCGQNITSIIWSDAFHNVTIWANDSAGNENASRISFTIDTTAPNGIILLPLSQNYANNESINLNISVIDLGVGLSSCWYSILNSTGGGIVIDNTTIQIVSGVCQNTSFNLTALDNNYKLILYSNDTLNNLNYTSVNFGIKMNVPSITLNYPSDNKYFKNGTSIYFNFTAFRDIGIDTISLYLNGLLNYTWINPTNNTMNFTILNLAEGRYNWTVGGNDTLNNFGWALNNFTTTIDLTNPTVTINSITTIPGSLIITFNSNNTDNYLLSICKYSVYNSLGAIDGTRNNVSFTCTNTAVGSLVSVYGTYTLRVYAEDKAGNEIYSEQIFVTSASSGGTIPTGGGGGGSTINTTISKSFCGDGLCEPINGFLQKEDFYTCPNDCTSPINLDEWFNTLLKNCFDSDESTICLWTSIIGSISNPTVGPSTSFTGQYNLDTLLMNCFSKDENINKQCVWKTSTGGIIFLVGFVLIFILMTLKIPTKGKSKTTIPKYIIYQSKKIGKRKRN
ncbi:MAG: Ig-like domain-containing protein, partial [Candidatus Woesearchaeota archaeon]